MSKSREESPRATASRPTPRATAFREGGNLVSKAHQLGGRVFARMLKRHGVDELNPAQGRIIFELWKEDGINQSELAFRTKLDKSTLALMLDRLESAGQILRVRDDADKRLRSIHLTDRNRGMHDAYLEASREMTELYYKGMGEKEIDAFEKSLRKILANLEE